MDRYNHDLGGDDTDETDDSPLFGSFSSYSPQYRKQNSSRILASNDNNELNVSGDANISICSGTSSISSGAGGDGTNTQNSIPINETKIISRPELRKLDVSFIKKLFISLFR